MKSKTSFFNKTLFVKNILRFWPVWGLYLVILFFMLPVSIYQSTNSRWDMVANVEAQKLSEMVRTVNFAMQGNIFVICGLSVVFALLIFGFLFYPKSCNMIHALPVNRNQLFFTGYLNGMLFFILPQILMFLVSLIVCIMNNVTCVEYLLYWLLFSIMMTFLFFSMAVFCCMLSGNSVAVFIFYGAGNILYLALKYLVSYIISAICYGMSGLVYGVGDVIGTKDNFFSPLIYLMETVGVQVEHDNGLMVVNAYVTGTSTLLLYMIPAALFLVLALVLYKKRQLECAGDIVSFLVMKPVFRWLVAFCMGVGLGLIFTGVFFNNDVRFTPILIGFSAFLTLVFFFLSEMILRKRFRVFQRKCWIEGIACAAVSLFLIGGLEADFFGVEKKVPKAEDIDCVLLSTDEYDMVVEDSGQIETLLEIHRGIVEHKKEYEAYELISSGETVYAEEVAGPGALEAEEGEKAAESELEEEKEEGCYTNRLEFDYYLKNGKMIKRIYAVPADSRYQKDPDSAIARIYEMQKNPDEYLKYVICKNYKDVTYTSATMDTVELTESGKVNYSQVNELDSEQAVILYEAIVKDIQEGNYPYYGGKARNMGDEHQYYSSLSFTGRVKENIRIYDELPQGNPLLEKILYGTAYRSQAYTTQEVAEVQNSTETMSVSFNIYDTCTYTIDALIQVGAIDDASELVTWAQYEQWIQEQPQG